MIGYEPCNKCGVYTDDGNLRGKKYYCHECIDTQEVKVAHAPKKEEQKALRVELEKYFTMEIDHNSKENIAAVAKLAEVINTYKKLLDIINNHSDAAGVCNLSKKQITALYGLSYTGTLNKLKFLVTYGLLIDHKPGFSCTKNSLIDDTPIGLVPRLFSFLSEHTELHNDYKAQSEIIGAPHKDIQVAWGYLSYCFGSKYVKRIDSSDSPYKKDS